VNAEVGKRLDEGLSTSVVWPQCIGLKVVRHSYPVICRGGFEHKHASRSARNAPKRPTEGSNSRKT